MADRRSFIAPWMTAAREKTSANGRSVLDLARGFLQKVRMEIYVGKNGQQLGPFSLEEINRKLADRTFAGTDLAWYEGAAGWAPLATVTGVVIPAAVPAPAPVPASTPASAPASIQPAPIPPGTPMRPNTPIVQPTRSPYRTLVMVSWILLGITFVISLIPFIGCGASALAWPVAVAAIIMGIIIVTRGGTVPGVVTILGGILIVPLCLLGQFGSLALVSQLAPDNKYKNQIMENLRSIDSAKTQFVTQTKAADGAPVTMAILASYLSGKEIKPVVGEQYDPMPVGQAPTATLPATKTLGSFKGGEILTVEKIEKDTWVSWSTKRTTTWSSSGDNSPTPAPQMSVAATPKASVAPSVSASPKTSAAPKSTSPPRSLISPRQNVEPEDSPTSGPSPSAKFAPRNGPRQSPSEDQPNSEKSGGPKQGRQYPRESPSESPEATPDDE
jgi:hypothetical protein